MSETTPVQRRVVTREVLAEALLAVDHDMKRPLGWGYALGRADAIFAALPIEAESTVQRPSREVLAEALWTSGVWDIVRDKVPAENAEEVADAILAALPVKAAPDPLKRAGVQKKRAASEPPEAQR